MSQADPKTYALDQLRATPGYDRLTDRARAVLRYVVKNSDMEQPGGPLATTLFEAFYADPNSVPGFVLRSSLGCDPGEHPLAKLGSRRFPLNLTLDQLLRMAHIQAKKRLVEGHVALYVGSEDLFQAALATPAFRVLLDGLGLLADSLQADQDDLLTLPTNRYVMVFTYGEGTDVYEFAWRGEEFPTAVLLNDDGLIALNPEQERVLAASGFNFEPQLGETLAFEKLPAGPLPVLS